MSQWSNPSWPEPSASQYPPKPRNEYHYTLPGAKYVRAFNEHEGAPPPAPGAHPGGPPVAYLVGVPMAPPVMDAALGRGQQGPYAQVPLQQYPIPAAKFPAPPVAGGNPGNGAQFHMHADQWDQLALGVRQQGPSENNAARKPRTKLNEEEDDARSAGDDSSEDGSGTRTLSLRDNASKVAKRSRMGCLTCRQRKKRCCETRPKCKECLRLRLNCVWPKPGTEHKNKPKEVKNQENMIDHDVYGKIKVLRGIVEYRSD